MANAKKELGKVMMSLYLILVIVAVGIAMAAYGIMNDILGLIIAGPNLAVFGAVFGIPLIWLRGAEKRKSLRIAVLVLDHERITFALLASTVGVSDAVAREKAVWCLNHGYLPGYVIAGEEVLLSKLLDPNLQEHAVECPNCGASFKYVGKIGQCPYCGDYYPPQNKH